MMNPSFCSQLHEYRRKHYDQHFYKRRLNRATHSTASQSVIDLRIRSPRKMRDFGCLKKS